MMRGNSKLRSEMLFGDASSEAFLCVYVGRISKEKRLDVIVEAVKNIPNAYLAIIGDGPSAPFYAAVHGKESRIYCKPRFLTHAELARVYASADVHVSASQFETLGNTVLEAFACGIPVVVPRCQGFCDTVADKLDGYLFAPGNSSSAQEFIQLLKDDPMHRSKMGEHGRLVVSSHTVSHVVKDLVAWYVRGINRKEETALFTRFCALCVLLVTVPIAIIALWCYERLVSISINIRHVMPVARVLQVRGMKEYCEQFKPYCANANILPYSILSYYIPSYAICLMHSILKTISSMHIPHLLFCYLFACPLPSSSSNRRWICCSLCAGTPQSRTIPQPTRPHIVALRLLLLTWARPALWTKRALLVTSLMARGKKMTVLIVQEYSGTIELGTRKRTKTGIFLD